MQVVGQGGGAAARDSMAGQFEMSAVPYEYINDGKSTLNELSPSSHLRPRNCTRIDFGLRRTAALPEC